MVEKGLTMGLGNLPGRDGHGLERLGSRATDFETRGDEKFGIISNFQPILYDFGPPAREYQLPCCPLSPFSRAHLSSPPSLAPEDAPWVSWAASDGFWSGWLPHLGCARRRRPASGQSWSHHGTWDRPGRDADALEGRGSRGTGFGTPGDENFWIGCDCSNLV